MVNILKPEDISDSKEEYIPDVVFDVVNALITQEWNGRSACIKQKDIIEKIGQISDLTKDIIYKKNYLDIENVYRKNGWEVEYESPAWGESFDAYFEFTKPKKR